MMGFTAQEVWKLARDNVSGCYADHVDLDTQEAKLGSSDSTGMGLVMECVADAMGWISRQAGSTRPIGPRLWALTRSSWSGSTGRSPPTRASLRRTAAGP